jgi:hypothetical protein
MTLDELSAQDAAGRLTAIRNALTTERHGRNLKAAVGAPTDAFDRNITRLEAQLPIYLEVVSPNGVNHLMVRSRCATCGGGPHDGWPVAP